MQLQENNAWQISSAMKFNLRIYKQFLYGFSEINFSLKKIRLTFIHCLSGKYNLYLSK